MEQPITLLLLLSQEMETWNAQYDGHNEIARLRLGSMSPELQSQFESCSLFDMLNELKSMFGRQAGVELFDLIQTFHACRHEAATPRVLVIQGGRIQKVNKKPQAKGKAKWNGKDKQVAYVPKPKQTPPAKKEHPAKDLTCHHCKEVGH